jgi:hypothetical protein
VGITEDFSRVDELQLETPLGQSGARNSEIAQEMISLQSRGSERRRRANNARVGDRRGMPR